MATVPVLAVMEMMATRMLRVPDMVLLRIEQPTGALRGKEMGAALGQEATAMIFKPEAWVSEGRPTNPQWLEVAVMKKSHFQETAVPQKLATTTRLGQPNLMATPDLVSTKTLHMFQDRKTRRGNAQSLGNDVLALNALGLLLFSLHTRA
mmetsp:Transcript_8271/g.51547  ORF Transcript_8271/g.51547 Transcript_8271/m.51547 type:complete len:150 (+) Transcript_8271:202-651(+)